MNWLTCIVATLFFASALSENLSQFSRRVTTNKRSVAIEFIDKKSNNTSANQYLFTTGSYTFY